MLFNSIGFVFFFLIVFSIYWFIAKGNLKVQNLLLLAASYVFYALWDWRFLFLLVAVSVANFAVGIAIGHPGRSKEVKKRFLLAGLFINVAVLVFFKYFNFFIEGFTEMVALTGYRLPTVTLRIIMPVGISFYTFLSISYLVDIYRGQLAPQKNIADVLLSLSFFPIILAGPIHRPQGLLPQIEGKREFDLALAVDGCRQFLWGLFMKTVIADRLADPVDSIFHNYSTLSGITLLLGVFYFSIQIYADFSGYSNMAIGVGKLLGFRLMRNFDTPYFSKDIKEFWRRWHISLMNWFRDYIFLPIAYWLSRKIKNDKIGFIKTDLFIYIAGILVTWLLTGLWHGANSTFIAWGLTNAFFLILYQATLKRRKRLFHRYQIKSNGTRVVVTETIITYLIISFSWIFFKSATISEAFSFISRCFTAFNFSVPQKISFLPLLIAVIVIEWWQRHKEHALQLEMIKFRPLRWGIYYLMIALVLFLGGEQQQFIYFQF